MPLKLVRRPKSPYWYIRGTIRGFRVEESTGVSNRTQAEEIRIVRAGQLLTESLHGKRAVATFAEAVVSYVESGGSRRFLGQVLKYFQTTPLARIDQDALDKGARKLFPNATGATRNRQFFTPVSAVLHHAARRGWCDRPIIQRPKAGRERVRWLSYEEADRLIASAAPHLRPLLVFLFYTGARAGEALWLEWRNVDLQSASPQVIFEKTKNRQPRGVPLHGRVVRELSKLDERQGYVFRRPDGRPYTPSRGDEDHSAGTRIKTAFKAACRRAGISDFSPHDCRHTWATWHYQTNRDLGALQHLGGWKSIRMVMRYAHTNVSELAATIDRLPGGNLGETNSKAGKSA